MEHTVIRTILYARRMIVPRISAVKTLFMKTTIGSGKVERSATQDASRGSNNTAFCNNL